MICKILLSENVNFLIADGVKFAHPLHHLGKSKSDLPLIAIDRSIFTGVLIEGSKFACIFLPPPPLSAGVVYGSPP